MNQLVKVAFNIFTGTLLGLWGCSIDASNPKNEQCLSQRESKVDTESRAPEYLFRLADGRYIYVSVDGHDYSYDSFKFFIGLPENMREVLITNVRRLRDGGTTYITTVDGALYKPSSLRREDSTWNKTVIERVSPALFRITETRTSARLTKKE